MSVLGLLYGVAMATQLLFVLLAVGATRIAGAQIREITLGMPGLLPFSVGSMRIKVGPLPSAAVDMVDFEKLSLSKQLVIRLGPWIVQLAIAMALLGPGDAMRSFANAFGEVLSLGQATMRAEYALAFLEHAPPATLFGVVLAKIVAFNLLPFPALAGGEIVNDVVFRSRGKQPPALWMVLGLLCSLVIAGWWVVAFVRAL
jgi:hypothetical protein